MLAIGRDFDDVFMQLHLGLFGLLLRLKQFVPFVGMVVLARQSRQEVGVHFAFDQPLFRRRIGIAELCLHASQQRQQQTGQVARLR